MVLSPVRKLFLFQYIDFIYIRAASGTKWLLYDSKIIGTPIQGMGFPTWDDRDVIYGQAQTALRLKRAYKDND
eukprot:1470996-Heterocapsa_arctica.AAC.1